MHLFPSSSANPSMHFCIHSSLNLCVQVFPVFSLLALVSRRVSSIPFECQSAPPCAASHWRLLGLSLKDDVRPLEGQRLNSSSLYFSRPMSCLHTLTQSHFYTLPFFIFMLHIICNLNNGTWTLLYLFLIIRLSLTGNVIGKIMYCKLMLPLNHFTNETLLSRLTRFNKNFQMSDCAAFQVLNELTHHKISTQRQSKQFGVALAELQKWT